MKKTPGEIVEDIAEGTGEVLGELVQAPFKAIGSFLDSFMD